MSDTGPERTGYAFDDYLREKLADEQWRIEWGGEEAVARVATSLFRAREKRGLSQAALADRAGTKQPNVSAIETGEGNPTVRTLGRLAVALAVDVAELLRGEDRYAVYRRTGFENLRRGSDIQVASRREPLAGQEVWDSVPATKRRSGQKTERAAPGPQRGRVLVA